MKKMMFALLFCLTCYAGIAFAAINVNTATQEELTGLSGIGPAKAAAIVEDRQANGDYQAVEDLTRVSGIGGKTLDGLRSEASVGAE